VKKILGILGLLVTVCVLTSIFSEYFLTARNVELLLQRSALFGIISIGAALVIMTGGIDLSIGSVVCLVGCLTPWLLVHHGWPVAAAVPAMLGLALCIGLFHGLLITKLRLQPFVVTLCGFLMYRGLTRGRTADQTMGFDTGYAGLKFLASGRVAIPFVEGFALPAPLLILIVVATAASVFLNLTVWGRYLLAVGRNETAARYSGIGTHRIIILAYLICGLLSGLGGLLFVADVGSAQPVDFGMIYELYAIAAAVLGGCSLRGGEGTIVGAVIGAAVMQVLYNSINLIDWIPNNIEWLVIGAVLLAGVIAAGGRIPGLQRLRRGRPRAAAS
jgi:ribose transport system permease protein